jgi:glycosyltransferase involved in cell wall biosynthesis
MLLQQTVGHAMSSVDVIVPCYRYGHFLEECVDSVLAQSAIAVRVLIIDDASPDKTAEVAANLASKDSRVTFVRHSTNKGHIATYNEGLAWASGTYTLLLSADDYLLPGALDRAASLMDVHPAVGFIFGKAIDLADGEQRTLTSAKAALAAATGDAGWSILTGMQFFRIIETSGSVNIVRTPTAVVRTELHKRLGGYRPDLPHSGDLEMWIRLACHADVGVIGAYQAAYRFHGENMQAQYYRARHLADLEQRKAAFDYLVGTADLVVPNAVQLHRNLLKPLAYEAIRNANSAFSDNELDSSMRLSAFARAVHPEIRATLPWVLLSCKRRMGLKLWRALVPVLRRIHHWALRKLGSSPVPRHDLRSDGRQTTKPVVAHK